MNSRVKMILAALKDASIETGPVFPSLPRSWFEAAVKAANLKNFTWHCLRHTFISRRVMAGVDLRTVQELAGHKTIQMTMRYAHLSAQHEQSVIEKLVALPPILGHSDEENEASATTSATNHETSDSPSVAVVN